MIHFTTWADTIEVVNGARKAAIVGMRTRVVEKQWWKESNCCNSGGEVGRKGVWIHANIYTYSTQGQMHTQSSITVVIHHALNNETMGAEAFESSVTA